MKKHLLAGLLFLFCATEAMATTYTTENGYFDWDASGNLSATGVSQGAYDGFSFTLNSDSLDAAKPSGTTGSLTTATGGDANFSAGTQVSLTEISVISYASGADINQALTLMIVDSKGNEYLSSQSKVDYTTTYDPWFSSATDADGMKYSANAATYSFDGVSLTVGESYTAFFLDANGNAVRVGMRVSNNGDDGFDVLDKNGNVMSPGFSAGGLTIVTESTVPEPSTATLSLLALAGLMGRRRRR